MDNERLVKKYLRKIKRLLPACRKDKSDIINMIKDNLEIKTADNSSKDISEIIEEFGAPSDVAAAYIEQMGTAQIIERFAFRKKIVMAVLFLVIGILFIWGIYVTAIFIDAHNTIHHDPGNDTYTIETISEGIVSDDNISELNLSNTGLDTSSIER